MRAAEELLKIVDIAQLDIGVMRPDITTFQLQSYGRSAASIHALSRRLRLKVVSCREAVRSDRVLLRRSSQEYLSRTGCATVNAAVFDGFWRTELEICVYDTGPGIASHQRRRLLRRVHAAQAAKVHLRRN